MRADRLVAALLVLQARGRVTACELAEELEVSERTARRDLEGLAMAGIPVYSQPGRGGGWTLVGGARTDLSGLTASEARTLFMVAGPSAATPEVKAALRKLVAALPSTFRSAAESAAEAVVLDPTAWDHSNVPAPPRFLDDLQGATIDAVQIRLGYTRRDGAISERIVHPLGLVVKNQVWYLVAHTDAGLRTFRVSRVRSVDRTTAPVQRPEGFDLAAAWRDILTEVDEKRAPVTTLVRTDPRTGGELRYVFGNRMVRVIAQTDTEVEVEIRGHSDQSLAEQLAGFGPYLEVLSPEGVRSRLALIGRALLERYGAEALLAAAT